MSHAATSHSLTLRPRLHFVRAMPSHVSLHSHRQPFAHCEPKDDGDAGDKSHAHPLLHASHDQRDSHNATLPLDTAKRLQFMESNAKTSAFSAVYPVFCGGAEPPARRRRGGGPGAAVAALAAAGKAAAGSGRGIPRRTGTACAVAWAGCVCYIQLAPWRHESRCPALHPVCQACDRYSPPPLFLKARPFGAPRTRVS